MPHIPFQARPIPQRVENPTTGRVEMREPPPAAMAPLASQPLASDLPSLPPVPDITDLPLVPPQHDKPPVGRIAPRRRELSKQPSGLAPISIRKYTVDPADVAKKLFGR